jgi:hypothetical protein
VQAEIAVGIELPLMPKYADLVVPGEYDPAVPIRKLSDFTDILLDHIGTPPSLFSSARTLYYCCCCSGRSFGISRP